MISKNCDLFEGKGPSPLRTRSGETHSELGGNLGPCPSSDSRGLGMLGFGSLQRLRVCFLPSNFPCVWGSVRAVLQRSRRGSLHKRLSPWTEASKSPVPAAQESGGGGAVGGACSPRPRAQWFGRHADPGVRSPATLRFRSPPRAPVPHACTHCVCVSAGCDRDTLR